MYVQVVTELAVETAVAVVTVVVGVQVVVIRAVQDARQHVVEAV